MHNYIDPQHSRDACVAPVVSRLRRAPGDGKVSRVGFFHTGQPSYGEPRRVQSGVVRTNCVDCLDRTNVLQFFVGLEAGCVRRSRFGGILVEVEVRCGDTGPEVLRNDARDTGPTRPHRARIRHESVPEALFYEATLNLVVVRAGRAGRARSSAEFGSAASRSAFCTDSWLRRRALRGRTRGCRVCHFRLRARFRDPPLLGVTSVSPLWRALAPRSPPPKLEVFKQQLSALGLLREPRLDYDSSVVGFLSEMYDLMGDHLALQYAGSVAHKKYQLLGCRPRMMPTSKELKTSITRHYSNSFHDIEKQALPS